MLRTEIMDKSDTRTTGCCNQRHLINIKNVKNNEEIHHSSLVLIVGYVSSLCSNHKHSDKISVQNPLNSFADTFVVSQINKQFKCVIEISIGSNNVQLQYGSTVVQLNVVSNQNAYQKYTLKLLYIICDGHNGEFQSPGKGNTKEVACRKIDVAIRLIQCIVAEKLFEQGFGRRAFVTSADGCQPFYSRLSMDKARSMTERELWDYFARELVARYPANDDTKFVAFLGCTKYTGHTEPLYVSHESAKEKTVGNAALGGGNLALFGTGCLYTWPTNVKDTIRCFLNIDRIDAGRFLDDSNGRRTFGGCFATTLGSVCHEIGHILDLGHTLTGIMGNGFDYVNRVFTIDNLTEELIGRITGDETNGSVKQADKRLTKIKPGNAFLQKYQLQRDNDLTFFERNSAVTLAYHKWIADYVVDIVNEINVDVQCRKIVSKTCVLRLIEFRTNDTGLMKYVFTFLEENVFQFKIPDTINVNGLICFVIDDNGNIRKTCFGTTST